MTLIPAETGQRKFRDLIVDFAPPWLKGREASKTLYVLGRMVDTVRDSQNAAVAHRFPGSPVYSGGPPSFESLSLIGRDRGLIKGAILETNESYALRLRGWLQAHKRRGSTRELLRQLRAYHGAERFEVQVIARSGLRITMPASEPLEFKRDYVPNWSPDNSPELWARVLTVFVNTEIYHNFLNNIESFPASEQARKRKAQARAISDLRGLIIDFTPAHIAEIQVIIAQGKGLWDALSPLPGQPDELWDEGDLAWDSPVDEHTEPIRFVIGPIT